MYGVVSHVGWGGSHVGRGDFTCRMGWFHM